MAVTTTDFTPRVWPGCLSCYNSGRLVGHWVDCVGADTVTLQAIHEGTGGPFPGCEEIWCLDIENVPVGREIGLDEAAEWGRVFTEAPSDRNQWPLTVTPADPLSDLHRDGSRSGLHLPNERHEHDPTDPISVSNQPTVPR